MAARGAWRGRIVLRRTNSSFITARSPRSVGHRRAAEIVMQRDRLVAEVSRLETAHGRSSRFGAQARDLLTRAWSSASWKSRQDLVRTVQWLLQLESRAAALEP
ncbi:MAG TPA: hypothetical protein VNR11_03470 [Xanthobacteraceae bacterium]|nr:hypothetical protein [Xanthobacteraceae bacterium]